MVILQRPCIPGLYFTSFAEAESACYLQAGQNLNAIRTWMFVNGNGESVSTDTTNRAAQITPGVYNETVLRRFDRIIATAGTGCLEASYERFLPCRLHSLMVSFIMTPSFLKSLGPECPSRSLELYMAAQQTCTETPRQNAASLTAWEVSQPIPSGSR